MPVCQVTKAQMFQKCKRKHKKDKKRPKNKSKKQKHIMRSTNHSQELPMSYRQFHKATIPICDNKKFLISVETAGRS